ncbi:MAG: transferase hexapeptide repeat containing protein [Planctomycetes bacterium]|nr:transferase hexapeptide repeat containing protein [Planctomycetota bacterium]
MAEATLEQRMTVLEERVRELQDAMISRPAAPDWLDCVIGSMKDEPAFDEVLAHGRAAREADRPVEGQAK